VSGFDPAEYGRHIASSYDDLYPDLDTDAAVATLAALADGGAVLELGIGSGRIALALAARGLAVHGVEGSPEMLAQLRAKPGGDLPVELGNFAEVEVGRTFALVALVFNTIFALPDQDAQVATFANAARHLEPGGAFVVEAWVPDVGAFRSGKALRLLSVRDGRVVLEAAELFPADQRMSTTKVFLDGQRVEAHPANHRYAWPAELDLMARLAGLELAHRWRDWSRQPFTDSSPAHVSVYRKPG